MGAGAAIIGAGALSAVGSIASASIGSDAAKSAAETQANAANEATALQEKEFNTIQSNYQPYLAAGSNALTQLQGLTGTNTGGNPMTASLTKSFDPTMASLAATPGYQFTLQQGEEAAQNGFAAQGLGSSGAAIKGAANYAEGLAGTTYQQQFQNYWTQNQAIYNELSGIAGVGENAAAGSGNTGAQVASNIGSTLQASGAASAAGTVGSANAITGALGSIGSTAQNTALLYTLNGNGLFGSPASSGAGSTNGALAANSLNPGGFGG